MDAENGDSFIDDATIQQALRTLPVLTPRTHTVYDALIRKKPEDFERLFQILGQKRRLPHRTLPELSARRRSSPSEASRR